jgi:hypothetical protein
VVPAFEERSDGSWELPLPPDASVQSVDAVRGDFVVKIRTGDAVIDAYCGRPASPDQLRELVGSRVTRIVATADGSLRLRTDRHEVVVPPGDTEAWEIRTSDDILAVSEAGGGLAIF